MSVCHISVEAGEETHCVCFLAPFYFCFKLFRQLIGYYDLAKAGKATMKNKIGKILWSQRMDGLSVGAGEIGKTFKPSSNVKN